MSKLELAEELGIYQDGWTYIDYCLAGAPEARWINTIITGEKGTYKSNTMLQHGYGVFHGYDEFDSYNRGKITNWQDMDAWERVLHYCVYRPANFDAIIAESLKEHLPRAWVGWDDIRIHLSPALYSTNRKRWEILSGTWAGSRGLIAIFECTAPTKSDVVAFIRHDMNYDIQMTGRRMQEVYRWFSRGDYYDPGKDNWYRIDVEKVHVDRERVPSEIWQRYDETTKAIREESAQGMRPELQDMDKVGTQVLKRQPSECPYCHRLMNEWNLKIHVSNCKVKPLSPPPI